MYRQAFQVSAFLALAAVLSACGGQGGYGLGGANNANTIDRVVLSNASGQANVFLVAPPLPLGGGIPPGVPFLDRNGLPTTPEPLVQVNAVGVRGAQSVVVPDAKFTWTASLTIANNIYYYSNAGANQKLCSPATATSSNTVLPDVSPFSSTPVIWVSPNGQWYQPLAPQQLASTVYISPAPESLVTYAPNAKNYCITLTAVGTGAQTITQVAVTSQP